jgi:carboxymethylenebutenolidase
VIGFCWGGGQSFRYATNNTELAAAVVCYGPAPSESALARIGAPVLGVYGENDARINAGIQDAEQAMRELGKPYRYTIYDGAGHAFLRRGEPAGEVDRAWRDIYGFLGETIGR